jgi:hypothetical protein
MYGGVKIYLLSSAVEGGEWSASRFVRFTPWEGAHSTHWIVWIEWAAEPVWILWRRENLLLLEDIELRLSSL